MNPNHEQTNIRLPKPMSPTIGEHPPAPIDQGEHQPAALLEASAAAQQMPIMAPPSAAPMQDAAQQTIPFQAQPAASSVPHMADDSDLIEREWVEKAKQIVASTRDDPYMQTQEVTKFKADYIKKRYNKDIKLADT